ncbi:hypothetical protein FACS1894195_5390 [Bacteroidia bacterium]|nr:hypothetical protein FACS1894195_5390 [Bacteroidia bacterium]
MAYNIKYAINRYPTISVVPSRILLSHGSLNPKVGTGQMQVGQNGHIVCLWDYVANGRIGDPSDLAMMAILNPTKNEMQYVTNGFRRDGNTLIINLPLSWKYDFAHPYFAFISEDKKQVSNSVYYGGFYVM